MSKAKRKLTERQTDWVNSYKLQTGFEPTLLRGELDNGACSFRRFAERNTQWLRDWAQDTTQTLERRIP